MRTHKIHSILLLVLTALSLATALASRRAIYFAGICLLLFSDMMIGGKWVMQNRQVPGEEEILAHGREIVKRI